MVGGFESARNPAEFRGILNKDFVKKIGAGAGGGAGRWRRRRPRY